MNFFDKTKNTFMQISLRKVGIKNICHMEYTYSQHNPKWVKLKYFSIGSKLRQNIHVHHFEARQYWKT